MIGNDRMVVKDHTNQKGMILQIYPISEIKDSEGLSNFIFLINKVDDHFIIEKGIEEDNPIPIENYEYFARGNFIDNIEMVRNYIKTLPIKQLTSFDH